MSVNSDGLPDDLESTSDDAVVKIACEIHSSHSIIKYCVDHKTLCCEQCLSTKHRSCQLVLSITEAVDKTFKPPEALETINRNLMLLILKLDEVKETRTSASRRLVKEREGIRANIQVFQQELHAFIDRLTERALNDVDQGFNELNEKFKNDIAEVDKQTEDIKAYIDYINTLDPAEDVRCFIHAIRTENKIEKNKVFINELETLEGTDKLEFIIDPDMEKFQNNHDRLGNLKDYFTLSMALLDICDVTSDDDTSDCMVSGCCILQNGLVVITDVRNSKVKVLDASYHPINQLTLETRPLAVCATGKQDVAMALIDDMSIQFANITQYTVNITRKFHVGLPCRGVGSDGEYLYVSAGGGGGTNEGIGQVRVYTLHGEMLQIFQSNKNGEEVLLTMPLDLWVDGSRKRVLVANRMHGIVEFTMDGQLIWTFNHPELKRTTGVCQIDATTYIVCGFDSKNILQVGSDGKRSSLLLEDMKDSPRSMYFNRDNKALIVTGKTSKIYVYQIYRGDEMSFPSGTAL